MRFLPLQSSRAIRCHIGLDARNAKWGQGFRHRSSSDRRQDATASPLEGLVRSDLSAEHFTVTTPMKVNGHPKLDRIAVVQRIGERREERASCSKPHEGQMRGK
jgi:hypothetical protein